MNKVSLTKDIEELHARGMLETLLSDRTTGGNIIWAAHEYARKGDGYSARSPILISQITGKNARTVKPRAAKRKERREGRTKERGEVFTPFWVVQKMCGIAERELCPAKRAKADRDAFIRARVLEICCGEAPFLTTRYAPDTGERIDPPDRAGILDRKLAVVRKHTKSRKTYIARAMEALRSVYGYEFSGDSLFIARINVLKSLIEHAGYAGYPLTCAEARDAAETVSRNIWQMDGLLGLPPYGIAAPTAAQLSLFEDLIPAPECSVYDYRGNQPVKYSAIGKEECEMKFDESTIRLIQQNRLRTLEKYA